MMQIKQILTIAILLSSFFAFGQTNSTSIENQAYIEVIGTAENEVIPDEIYIGIVIRERYVNKVKMSIEEQEEKLKSAVKSLGVDLSNLSLSDANADFIKVRWQKKEVMTKKDYTLKVSNATTVGNVFLELEKLEINDAYISRVNHSKLDSLKKEIKIKAIKHAKEKANYLLSAIGEQVGKPLIIKENENLRFDAVQGVTLLESRNRSINYLDGMKMKSEENNDIQFQKIKLQTSMYVRYAIK